MQLTKLLFAITTLLGTAFAVPAGKPTGGPATAQVTIYSGPYTCASADQPPPKDGSAGTSKIVNIAETQCIVVSIPFGGALTASMTATPKTGTIGCYIQIFSQQGCGLTLQNQYHGFPFDGVTAGSTVGCASPPVQSYGGLQIVCG
ncbi:uncharacterized protein M421DRAFT_418909 [Didymella exigua CBS 183.55]|uniref:Hypersensitive response-inducing protein n=1 Tax=Didymella exigua CBS 183.55 TaxID=1150837 RepID=A0A6A5RQ93_9PLEO|nr:uncharacterized protein M421DRAFT_418909 [Didymella exigua CBS 183.55]KAF1930611.1 hypothetical protein M421DRAFT_418909 [Didymella exigua CBS 183.55]